MINYCDPYLSDLDWRKLTGTMRTNSLYAHDSARICLGAELVKAYPHYNYACDAGIVFW